MKTQNDQPERTPRFTTESEEQDTTERFSMRLSSTPFTLPLPNENPYLRSKDTLYTSLTKHFSLMDFKGNIKLTMEKALAKILELFSPSDQRQIEYTIKLLDVS